MSSIAKFLEEKTILITGATGFLGQPLVEKILWAAPQVRRLYVLIRAKKQFDGQIMTAQQRLEKELFDSTVFERLQGSYQDALHHFLRRKLVAVEGDISQDGLGINPEVNEKLRSELDVVINCAAVVSFDAPLDEALQLNVFGAQRITEFTRACRKAIFVHVSTAYACGAARGEISETLYHNACDDGDDLFPLRRFRDVEREIKHLQEIIRRIQEKATSPELERQFRITLLKSSRKGKNAGRVRRREKIESLRKRWLADQLTREGMVWARQRGWNDTYTYTKALGEQFVFRYRGETPTALVRPSVIESSLSEPNPGWLDGLRMADPLIVAIGKGRLRSLPLNPDVHLDLIPVDMVVNIMLAILPGLRERNRFEIYQVATGSENPISLGNLYELVYQYFVRNPMLDRSGDPIRVKPLRFPKPAAFRMQHRLRSAHLYTAEKTLEKLSAFDVTQKVKRRVAATKAANQRLYYYGEIYEPYLNLDCRFKVTNTQRLFRQLSQREQETFNFDVTRLNWRHYIQNVHIPGVKKFILKIEGSGTMELAEETPKEGESLKTIPDLLDRTAGRCPNRVALRIKRNNAWQQYTFAELRDFSCQVARNLAALGLKQGDKVILYSENQPEWGIAFLGAARLGLIVVPLDSQTWFREVWSVAEYTEARALLLSERCLAKLPSETLCRNEQSATPRLLLDVNRFCRPYPLESYPRSAPVQDIPGDCHEITFPSIRSGDPVSIIFTTGTSVDPKGVVHTHQNFLNNLFGVNHYLSVAESDHFLSVLPLYHALEFTCGFLMAIYGAATVTYATSLKPRVLLETMRECGITCMLGVPTLYALIRDDIERRILKTSKSALKSNLMNTSKQISRSFEDRFGKNIGHRLFAKVHEEFGGRIRVFVSGGSALGEDLYRDFKSLGMPIYEGYGLTETAPVLTVNPLYKSREGSAGKPLPGVELRLYHPDQDGIGEIIVRSPGLMQGYYKNEQATRKVCKDGWFHTGDLGWVDTDGYVYVTGRIKNVIVTGAGKNVYPEDLEAIYRELECVEEICVLGLKNGLTEEIHAAIFPKANRSEPPQKLKKQIQQQIQGLARQLPSYQRLQTTHIWERPLPRTGDGGWDRDQIRSVLLDRQQESGSTREREFFPKRVKEARQEEFIYRELARLSGEPVEEISEESNLYTDLGFDSLLALELLLSLEQHFNVKISDEKAASFQVVGEIIRELRRHHRLSPATTTDFLSGSSRRSTSKGIRSALPLPFRPAVDRALMKLSFTGIDAIFRRYFRLEVSNGDALPGEGAYIIAANHSSHLDTGAVIASLCAVRGVRQARKLHVLGARDYFFTSRLKSWLYSTLLNVVPLERDDISLAGLRMIRSILHSGEPILIFPEGTRSRTGELQPFKPGIGLIAWELKVPIVPALLKGTFEAMPAGKNWPCRRRIAVRFGRALLMEDYEAGERAAHDDLYRRIAKDVRTAIEDLSGDSDLAA